MLEIIWGLFLSPQGCAIVGKVTSVSNMYAINLFKAVQ